MAERRPGCQWLQGHCFASSPWAGGTCLGNCFKHSSNNCPGLSSAEPVLWEALRARDESVPSEGGGKSRKEIAGFQVLSLQLNNTV